MRAPDPAELSQARLPALGGQRSVTVIETLP
jgi:hypothetical protein